MSDPRRVALEVLLRVEQGGAYANATLDSRLGGDLDLSPRDRALATELVYGTLRRALSLDWILGQRSNRPIDALDPAVRQILRLGAYQLLHLNVPDHAAVDSAVELTRQVGIRRATGFVNAVLRAVARGRDEPLAPPFEVDPALHLRIVEGLPEWVFEAWRHALPLEELPAAARAVNEAAPLCLRAPSPRARDEAVARLAERGVEARPSRLSPVGLVLPGGHPAAIPEVDALRLDAQDEAAQAATFFALAAGETPLEIRSVLDACAAPGGKAFLVAQALPDARVDAIDLHSHRVRRIEEGARRLGLEGRIRARAADVTRPLPFARPEGYDLVLVDAPCTGLGTLRRRPEIKLRRTHEDAVRLSEVQRRILEGAARHVAPGGRLVYVVCTYTPEETTGVVDAFLAEHREFSVEPAGDRRHFETWPHREGADGFFAVRLRRQT